MSGVGSSLLDQPLVFVDIETNGLSHIRDRVIEVAAIRVENGRVTRVFNQLVDPGTELPQFITRLTGIHPQNLKGASAFHQIAAELHDILSGAVFVAHNVRFDYSFLKAEFKRTGRDFLPKQLCTVKLSRALYPQEKSHKLESLIARYGLTYEKRHRAYDDALVLWQFLQHAYAHFPADTIDEAVAKQIGRPAIPKNISADLIGGLPDTPGVYIFEDEAGKPLYIGKSINIRKRVLQHFGRDHAESKEFKISQQVHHISATETGGELAALLLESRLIKELQPLYNRKLRRTSKLLLARGWHDENGYLHVEIDEAAGIEPEDLPAILAVYQRRSRAKESLSELQKTFDLCPKLLGLEKSKGACFLHQLHKCRGACAGRELPEPYNRRLQVAFERLRIAAWPYQGTVLITEHGSPHGIIVDNWCVIGETRQDEYCDSTITSRPKTFDLDTYQILQSFIETKRHALHIQLLSPQQLDSFQTAAI